MKFLDDIQELCEKYDKCIGYIDYDLHEPLLVLGDRDQVEDVLRQLGLIDVDAIYEDWESTHSVLENQGDK